MIHLRVPSRATLFRGLLPVLLLSLQAWTTAATRLSADDSLEQELRAMVEEHVRPLIEKRGAAALAVGGFTAATSVKGSAGPEIQMKLSSLLQAAGLTVDPDAYRYELSGNYLAYNDPDSGLYGVKLIGRLIDAESGVTLGEFPRFVFGPESVPRLLGLTVSTKGSQDPQVQSVAFRQASQRPTTYLVGTQVNPSPTSPFAVELLLTDRGRRSPVPIQTDDNGRPFAQLPQDQVYAVRLLNHADYDAAVQLTIDGINVFHFSEQQPAPKYWVVPKKQGSQPGEVLVRGWDKSADRCLEFKVVDLPASAAARVKLDVNHGIGLITATFAACWEHEQDRPRSEGRTRATGFGNELLDPKTLVKRHVGQVRDVITLRYQRAESSSTPVIWQAR
jgi:hypothetical protein